jgi:membrane protease YdiL (CAAX protease family)
VATGRSAAASDIALTITGRIAVAQAQLSANNTDPAVKANRDQLRKQLLNKLEQSAVSPLDKLKVVTVIGELEGPAAAASKLIEQWSEFTGSGDLSADAERLRTLYAQGPEAIGDGGRKSLTDDLGWFGELATTQGTTGPARTKVIAAAQRTFLGAVAVFVIVFAAFGLGILLLILMIVLFSLGKWRFAFRAGPPGGPPVFLETFALWGIGFVALLYARRLMHGLSSTVLLEFIFMVMSTLVALWPLARGVSWSDLQYSLGWHNGRGAVTEVGAGILGYIAGLPIVAAGVLLTLILSKAAHVTPTHPIVQEFTGPLPWSKVAGLLLAVSVFAPFLEETMFRGALYFHLRRRWRPWLSAAVVSLLFAAIHPQGWAGIPVLASIAIVLALLREWRGSLLASMTGHALNNGVVLTGLVLILR